MAPHDTATHHHELTSRHRKQRHLNQRRSRARRPGATLVESAIVLSVLLTFILGMLQLGLSTLQASVISDAARRLAREAAVHGAMAAPTRTVWGPVEQTGTAADSNEAGATLRKVLPTMNPAAVSYRIQWLDATNEPDQRILVEIEYTPQAVIPIMSWLVPAQLNASSTLRVLH